VGADAPAGASHVLQQMQESTEQATRKARQQQDAKGKTITGIAVPAFAVGPPELGEFRVNHGLGRKPKAWRIERTSGGAVQLREVRRTSRVLVLFNEGPTAATIDLLVY
jgi:hypothetical protein